MNKGINLLGERRQTKLSPVFRKLFLLRIIAVGTLFTVSATSIILFLLIFLSPLPALQQQEKNALSTIAQYHPDIAKIKLIDDRLKVSNIIIKKRNNLDKTLTELTTMMPSDLSITALKMKEKTVVITVSTGSLPALETFIKHLVEASDKKEHFSEVSLTTLATDEQKGLFLLTVTLLML